ncbi:MAG: hypothetical protein D4R65_09635 [Verrucomicrobiaceae bacterium]|nr:MAG: hypothetical protein D4R65_09635 [Verrucomicrobiaceae bacterium]
MPIPPPANDPARSKWFFGSFVLVVLLFLSQNTQAGTWTFKKWASDRDIPQPAPDVVTHAIAFGPPANAPVMPPFLLTNKIFGQTWSVWTHPDHTKMVAVGRMSEGHKDALRLGGEGASLVHGHIVPRGAGQAGKGISLELTGLEPGHAYNIALFGLGLSVDRDTQGKDKHQIEVSASDAADQPQTLDWDLGPLRNQPKFLVYEYTAPENGQISLFFKCPEGDRSVRFSSFMNFRVD